MVTAAAATIFAPATAAGRAGVAVMRLSGPQAAEALARLTGAPPPAPRQATLRRLSAEGVPLDRALILWFPAPHSFTGEDVAEVHVHGGRAVMAALAGALGAMTGLRPAEAGEFTRRAVQAGKMDLSAAEGLIDLIDAETEAQRRQALRQLEGALGRAVGDWRDGLVRALAYLEAAIDFPDEELPDDLAETAMTAARPVAAAIRATLDDGRRGERLRDGLYVAIVGAPNVGKSSLLNRLAGRDAAIVTDIAGTTRDVVEVHLDLGGVPVTVADTAGLRDEADRVEAEGIRRAHARAAAADLVLAVYAAGQAQDGATAAAAGPGAWTVVNKIDTGAAGATDFAVSAKTGAGVDDLVKALTTWANDGMSGGTAPLITRDRHRAALIATVEAIGRADAAAARGSEVALVAEDLRHAVEALGRITGRVDVEDLLDVVFKDFCIGK